MPVKIFILGGKKMKVNNYVKMAYESGIDYHDTYCKVEQIKWNGKYEVSKTDLPKIACKYIFEYFPPKADHIEKVKKAIYEGTSYCYPVDYADAGEDDDFGEDAYMMCIGKQEQDVIEVRGSFREINYNLYFHLYSIEDGKERYWVSEDFLAPFKGCPLIERLYHEPFNDARAAEEYCGILKKQISETAVKAGGRPCYKFETEAEKKEYVNNVMQGSIGFTNDVRGMVSSFPSLKIDDFDKIKSSRWYILQKQAMDLMKKKNTTPFSNPCLFNIDTESHIGLLN